MNAHRENVAHRRELILEAIHNLEQAQLLLNPSTTPCKSCDRENANNHDEWALSKKITDTVEKFRRELDSNPCLL